MSTLPSPAPASVYLVMATTDYETPDLLQAFLDEDRAKKWHAELQAYHATHPGWWGDDATDAERDAAYERLDAWRKAHPGGEIAAGGMGFAIHPLPLADAPTLLGYANAKELRHFQLGAAAGGRNDLVIAKDHGTHWRSRERDGEPVPVYL